MAQVLDFGEGGSASVEAPSAGKLDFCFQPRYVHAYPGPLVQGSNFWIGLGDDNAEPQGPKLEWRFNQTRNLFPVPLFADRSYKLRVQGKAGLWTLTLDGKPVGHTLGPERLSGPYLLGRGQDPNEQFFGRVYSLRWDGLGWTRARLSPDADWANPDRSWPKPRRHLRFPFPDGQIWNIIQGFDTGGGSHRGYAAFSLDLKRPDRPQQAAGTPFVAGARGRIVRLDQDFDSLSKVSNSLGLEMPGGEILDYLHLQTRSANVRSGQTVFAGQPLARVGDVGAGRGNHHLHLAWLSREQRPFVTLPFVFERYQVSLDQGATWRNQSMSLPEVGQWCRAIR